MQVNGVDIVSYNASPTSVEFVMDCDKASALEAMNDKDFELKAGETTIGVWKGFTVTGVVDVQSTQSDGTKKTYTRLMSARALAPDTATAIAGLEQNMQLVRNDVNAVKADVETAKASAVDVQAQMDALLGTDESAESTGSETA